MGDPVDLNNLIDQLRQLNDHDRAVVYAQSLSPTQATAGREHLIEAAAKILGDTGRATSFTDSVRLDAFTGTDGRIDPVKVQEALTKLGVITPEASRNFPHGSSGLRKGEAGKAEAAKRYGTKPNETPSDNAAPPGMDVRPRVAGQDGRDEAARRYGDMVLGKRGNADGQAIGIY